MGRRTHEQVEQLEHQILDVLKADNPQSVRHIFYRMTDPRLPEPVEKTEAGYKQVQKRLVKMRRAGTVEYGMISDATRRGYHVNVYDDGGDFLRDFASLYRGNLWKHARRSVEVWVESRSLAGVVQDACRELAVSLYPCGGFPSLTFVHDAATNLRRRFDRGSIAAANVIYIGDYDPSGVLIDEGLERDMREYLGAHADLLEFERLGITPAQISSLNLPTKPRKATERRRPDILMTVEAEAMPASTLRGLLRSKIEGYLPKGELAKVKEAERSEREGLTTIADLIDATGGSGAPPTMQTGKFDMSDGTGHVGAPETRGHPSITCDKPGGGEAVSRRDEAPARCAGAYSAHMQRIPNFRIRGHEAESAP